jgi:uncharacterized protein (TIGR02594 family)
VRKFQADKGLEPDGIVGPLTLGALFPGRPAETGLDQAGLVWLKEARRLMGTREQPGIGSNRVILDWAGGQGIPYKSDDIPWCGLFIGHCISSTLDREPLPTAVLRARAWERFGIKTSPTPGAVMVFWRRTRESGLGHVGFYVGEDAGAYRILGGNQSDSVSLAWIRKDRLVDARWPATVPAPIAQPIVVARDETLSWDEH